MKHIEITRKQQCSGCTACLSICPASCISMVPDEEGFLYPNVDEEGCLNCGLCIMTCPIISESREKLFANDKPLAYLLYHNNEEIRKRSSSGGAFTAICEAFCQEGEYAIFGAGYDDQLRVCHSKITAISEIDKFRKSKYVQSDMGNSFSQVKQSLDEGEKVLFSGTPCQIAGLISFLKKPYQNLITVDLICHGVPSADTFEKYKAFMERSHKDKIANIDFRDKLNAGWENSRIRIYFFKRKPYDRCSETTDDPYMNAFLSGLSLRPSCRPCLFARTFRTADISIGDLWGWDEIKPQLDDNRGLSLVLFNTEIAKGLVDKIGNFAYIEAVDIETAIKYNRHLVAPVQANIRREQFMSDLRDLSFEVIVKKYLKPRPLVNRLATRFLSKKTKELIKRIIGLNH